MHEQWRMHRVTQERTTTCTLALVWGTLFSDWPDCQLPLCDYLTAVTTNMHPRRVFPCLKTVFWWTSITGFHQWRIQGRGSWGLVPPLFLDQSEARRAPKNFFGRLPPPLIFRSGSATVNAIGSDTLSCRDYKEKARICSSVCQRKLIYLLIYTL